ncbi:hypothetical protein JOJ88_004540 [Pantoea cypripedii]|nr:hypothetical protein [Pantoea cypripedii]
MRGPVIGSKSVLTTTRLHDVHHLTDKPLSKWVFIQHLLPGEPMRDMKGFTRNGNEALKFRQTVNEKLRDVEQFRKELTALLSAEFVALTRPSPSVIGQFIEWCRGRCNF